MVTAGATANTTEGNSHASRESGLVCSYSHGEYIASFSELVAAPPTCAAAEVAPKTTAILVVAVAAVTAVSGVEVGVVGVAAAVVAVVVLVLVLAVVVVVVVVVVAVVVVR